MMVNLNHKLSKKFDIEMIGQCGIQIELNSWVKYELFEPLVHTSKGVYACLNTREIWDRNKFVIDNIFALTIT